MFSPYPVSLDATGIRAVAELLPELKHFSLDVGLELSPKKYPYHRPTFSRHLLRFRGPIMLHVFLHAYNLKLADFVLTRSFYYKIFHGILDEPERQGLHVIRLSRLASRSFANGRKMEGHADESDYRLRFLESGKITF